LRSKAEKAQGEQMSSARAFFHRTRSPLWPKRKQLSDLTGP
jgi:hypothetical protein